MRHSRFPKLIAMLLLLVAIAARIFLLPYSNHDLTTFNLPWYQTLLQRGIASALATDFSNYNPPYTYLLALATLTHGFLSPIIAIKLIPIAFDILGSVFIYKIVRLKFPIGDAPLLAAALYFSAPTVVVNSTYWGQADSIYVAFLLISLYSILTRRPAASLLAFGFALAVKAQAVFFLPFLSVMFLRDKIKLKHAALVPVLYLAVISPVVFLGRPWVDTLLIYVTQSKANLSLSMNAPNLYFLLPGEWYSLVMPAGLLLSVLLLISWVVSSSRSRGSFENERLVLYAFISVALTPFLLPKMHDRYFYPADVLSIALAFYQPQLWFVPVLYQLISFLSISVFLFNSGPDLVIAASLLNTLTLAFVLRIQERLRLRPAASSALSWISSGLTVLFILTASFLSVLSPLFFRIEYNLPGLPADARGYDKYELYQRASQIVGLAGTRRGEAYLSKLKFSDGRAMFSDEEESPIVHLRDAANDLVSVRAMALLGLFVFGLIAWSADSMDAYRRALASGGRAILVAAPSGALASFILLTYNSSGIYFQLFPIRAWQHGTILVCGTAMLAGYVLTRFGNLPAAEDKEN